MVSGGVEVRQLSVVVSALISRSAVGDEVVGRFPTTKGFG